MRSQLLLSVQASGPSASNGRYGNEPHWISDDCPIERLAAIEEHTYGFVRTVPSIETLALDKRAD